MQSLGDCSNSAYIFKDDYWRIGYTFIMHYPYSLHFISSKQKGTKHVEAVSPWDEPHLNRLTLESKLPYRWWFPVFQGWLIANFINCSTKVHAWLREYSESLAIEHFLVPSILSPWWTVWILFRTNLGSAGYPRGENDTSDVLNIILEGSRGPSIYFWDYANGKLRYACARKAVSHLNWSWRKAWAFCLFVCFPLQRQKRKLKRSES